MKVIVGISGGVDSTIAAYILKKQGYEVIGVYFDFLGTNNSSDLKSARNICDKLNIRLIEKNYVEEFRKKIIDRFINDYKNGITPNPCALCNGTMKFEKLLLVMKEEGADKIATGHYANVKSTSDGSYYYISKSENLKKDQSYMLYRLTKEQLSHIIFPISDMQKVDVRTLAHSLNLNVAEKKDSQDVCFIKDMDYKEYIMRYEFGDDYKEKIARGFLSEDDINDKPYFRKGEFIDLKGNVLGFHNGIINYTIGQRKGLNIAFGERKFVCRIDIKNNQVVLGDNADLMTKSFSISDIVYQKASFENGFGKIYAKVRYRHDGTECYLADESDINILKSNDKVSHIKFLLKEDVRAVTPGQSAVFYDENGNIIFGGIID